MVGIASAMIGDQTATTTSAMRASWVRCAHAHALVHFHVFPVELNRQRPCYLDDLVEHIVCRTECHACKTVFVASPGVMRLMRHFRYFGNCEFQFTHDNHIVPLSAWLCPLVRVHSSCDWVPHKNAW
jgi:hypothetical protein